MGLAVGMRSACARTPRNSGCFFGLEMISDGQRLLQLQYDPCTAKVYRRDYDYESLTQSRRSRESSLRYSLSLSRILRRISGFEL